MSFVVAQDAATGLSELPIGAPAHAATDRNGRLIVTMHPPIEGGAPTEQPPFAFDPVTGRLKVEAPWPPFRFNATSGLLETSLVGTAVVAQGSVWYVGTEAVVNTPIPTPTPLAAGRVVGGIITFDNIFRAVGNGILSSVTLLIGAPVPSAWTLMVFEAPVTVTHGELPAIPYSDWRNLVDVYQFNTFAVPGTGMSSGTVEPRASVRNREATLTRKLYGVLLSDANVTIPDGNLSMTMRLSWN